MNFFKRALKQTIRKPSKSILLILTFFLIGNLVIIGISVANASETAKTLTRKKMRAVVNYTIDYSAFYNEGDAIEDEDERNEFFKHTPTITYKEVSELLKDERVKTADNSIANGIISEIGKEIDIPSSTGEFIGVSKVIKEDVSRFNEILIRLIDEDRQNYYDFAYKPLSRDRKIDFVLTNGLKWTEIDDYNDWKTANGLIKEFEN